MALSQNRTKARQLLLVLAHEAVPSVAERRAAIAADAATAWWPPLDAQWEASAGSEHAWLPAQALLLLMDGAEALFGEDGPADVERAGMGLAGLAVMLVLALVWCGLSS
eukprot:SAG11_NODE_4779_length_1768_cov_8.521270_3_plen_109_part_00